MFRIGNGYDVHRLVAGRSLVLCGVEIPHSSGLDGHSDADVAVHAIIDALLGALALGDIGQWFPDDDPKWRDADSMEMLKTVRHHKNFSGSSLVNLDITIIAQEPKLTSFIPQMRHNLAAVFNCPVDAISVKATTTERLGFCGRGEGIATMASLLMRQ
ncbi:MAG: 2-C-methyl-D-erythritol 2,4-cyclodiphosphate synthase [Victivallaceae bacterium]|nr:2-C-methyl-D-erythritol 2,4-cyclodiphosphate synthase [Victivallaceae bacterium]